MDQFRRLARQIREKEDKDNAREEFGRAMVLDFNETFGVDASSLEAWQRLCSMLGVEPVPDEITECRLVSVLIVGYRETDSIDAGNRNSGRSMSTSWIFSMQLGTVLRSPNSRLYKSLRFTRERKRSFFHVMIH